MSSSSEASFWRLWLTSLAGILRDKGAVLLLFGAPVLYGFFYPWFYSQEVVQRVPVAVVVQDNSSLARQMLRFAQASPRIDPQLVTADEGEARAAVLRGEVMGYALLPREGAELLSSHLPLAILETDPADIRGWNPQIIWHRRNNADFALQWVRSEICLWFKKHPPMNPEMMLEDENRHR